MFVVEECLFVWFFIFCPIILSQKNFCSLPLSVSNTQNCHLYERHTTTELSERRQLQSYPRKSSLSLRANIGEQLASATNQGSETVVSALHRAHCVLLRYLHTILMRRLVQASWVFVTLARIPHEWSFGHHRTGGVLHGGWFTHSHILHRLTIMFCPSLSHLPPHPIFHLASPSSFFPARERSVAAEGVEPRERKESRQIITLSRQERERACLNSPRAKCIKRTHAGFYYHRSAKQQKKEPPNYSAFVKFYLFTETNKRHTHCKKLPKQITKNLTLFCISAKQTSYVFFFEPRGSL